MAVVDGLVKSLAYRLYRRGDAQGAREEGGGGAGLQSHSPDEREHVPRVAPQHALVHALRAVGVCARLEQHPPVREASTRRVRLVRGEGRGVSDWYGVRDAACPIGTG